MSDQPAPAEPGNAGPDDYPRMLFHPDGRSMTVDDATMHDRMAKEGWTQTPTDVHRKSVNPSPIIGASDPFAMMIRGVMEQVLDERGLTQKFTDTLAPSAQPEPPMVFPSKGGR